MLVHRQGSVDMVSKPTSLGTMPETHDTQKEQAGKKPLDVLSITNEITPNEEPAPYSLQLRMEDFNGLNQAPRLRARRIWLPCTAGPKVFVTHLSWSRAPSVLNCHVLLCHES